MSVLTDRIAALSPEKRALLERRLQAKRPDAVADRIPRRGPDDDPLPLSFAQQRLWFLDQLDPGSSLYNLTFAARLTGPVWIATLQAAIDHVVRRHESLRTTFAAVDGRPVQRIAERADVPLEVTELQSYAPAEREAEAVRLVALDAQRAFNLAAGPLLRATLLRLDNADHVLVLTMHHIVSDGWSLGVLHRELSSIYTALAAGRSATLAELPVQYADFALWQRRALQGPALEGHLAYWKGKLAGMADLLDLPTDHPRPRVRSFRGATYTFALRRRAVDALRAIGRRAEGTLFMPLLAAFGVLLQRYSRQTDVGVGTPIANRTRVELEPLIGFFVNTLVLRLDLSGDPSFLELVSRVRELTLEAYAHQDLPFERLVEEMHPERALGHNPVFQVMFILQNADAGPAPASLALAPGMTGGSARFDLTCCATEASDGGLVVALEYNTELFEAPTVVAMARNFEALIDAVVARPDERLSRIPLVDADERRRILCESAGDDDPAAAVACVHELCEMQARVRPDAIAVTSADEALTYRDLNARADRLARALRRAGVRPEVLVAICLERSVEWVVAILAIMKAGGAYVPLDPAHPDARLHDLLEDSGAAFLIAQTPDRLRHYRGRVFSLDALATAPEADGEDAPLAPWPHPDNIAYVIYTSGSTGRPKGVAVTHRGLVNAAEAEQRVFDLSPGTRILRFSTWTFDVSMFELLMSLRSGASLHVASPEALLPGPPLLDTLRAQRIQVLTLPTSVLSALPATPLPDLHTVVVGGEACAPELVMRWGGDRRFFNVYGPTEGSIWSVCARCTNDLTVTPPIGRAIPNVQAYLLDAHLELVPSGVPGELYLGGFCVARGYHRRPDLTAERFLPDPFARESGRRMYRTGDIARRLPDGQLQFLGRADQMLKLRGYRIEPAEIEAALMAHPGVQIAAVVPRCLASGETRLAAYFVASAGTPAADAGELRAFLRHRLPEYMVPAALVRVDALPRTATGKLDRAALPTIDWSTEGERTASTTAPRTPTEEALAGIWCELLDRPHVGIFDNFFDVGGHSLLVTRLASRILGAFGVELPLSLVFETPTIAALAGSIDSRRRSAEASSEPAIVPLRREVRRLTSSSTERHA